MEAATGLVIALTALATAVTPLVLMIVKLWRRDDVTDQRLDNLWEAHMRRGAAEATFKKLAVPIGGKEDVSAILVRPEVIRAYDPIAPALRRIRREMKGSASGQFAERVEKELGPWIAKHICAVLGVSEYAWLVMAQQVAEQPNGVDPNECSPEIRIAPTAQKGPLP